jgi:hypothetical protein
VADADVDDADVEGADVEGADVEGADVDSAAVASFELLLQPARATAAEPSVTMDKAIRFFFVIAAPEIVVLPHVRTGDVVGLTE